MPTGHHPLLTLCARLLDRPLYDPFGALRLYFSTLAPLLGVKSGIIVLSGRVLGATEAAADPLDGWRPLHIEHLGVDDAWHVQTTDEWIASMPHNAADPTQRWFAARTGQGRAITHRQLLLDAGVTEATSAQLMQELGICDKLAAVAPICPRAEVFVVFDRVEGQSPFTEIDRQLALTSMSTLIGPGRQMALMYGLTAETAILTERERQVLACLLRGLSEKEAAAQIGMSTRNCHQRVVRIYRHFGVRSRPELISQWMAGGAHFR